MHTHAIAGREERERRAGERGLAAAPSPIFYANDVCIVVPPIVVFASAAASFFCTSERERVPACFLSAPPFAPVSCREKGAKLLCDCVCVTRFVVVRVEACCWYGARLFLFFLCFGVLSVRTSLVGARMGLDMRERARSATREEVLETRAVPERVYEREERARRARWAAYEIAAVGAV